MNHTLMYELLEYSRTNYKTCTNNYKDYWATQQKQRGEYLVIMKTIIGNMDAVEEEYLNEKLNIIALYSEDLLIRKGPVNNNSRLIILLLLLILLIVIKCFVQK